LHWTRNDIAREDDIKLHIAIQPDETALVVRKTQNR